MLFNCGKVQNVVADQGHLEAELNADRAVKVTFVQRASLVLLTFYFSYHFKILK